MRTPGFLRLLVLSATLLGLVIAPGLLADGRIEINQASVEAAGGFPYTISEPGSYILTGSLTVPAETHGLIIDTSDVTIDLNGFSITGPATCGPSECEPGSSLGIAPQNFLSADASGSTVRNGVVRGFGAYCVWLTILARIENLMVRDCGFSGIVAGSGVVTGNRIFNTGLAGLEMGPETAFAHNHIAGAGLGGGPERAVQGGRASAGNSCDDDSCSPRGERRYYLTQTEHDGNEALGACATGFHMASLWEIFDPSNLYYDGELAGGGLGNDAGSGPPTFSVGWVRTGFVDFGGPDPGKANCLEWSSDDGVLYDGTHARLSNEWDANSQDGSPFDTGTSDCSVARKVWCVED